jgi:hypothetical protein
MTTATMTSTTARPVSPPRYTDADVAPYIECYLRKMRAAEIAMWKANANPFAAARVEVRIAEAESQLANVLLNATTEDTGNGHRTFCARVDGTPSRVFTHKGFTYQTVFDDDDDGWDMDGSKLVVSPVR